MHIQQENRTYLQNPNLAWFGLAIAGAFWIAESAIHTYVFDNGPLTATLLGESDSNEIWMRLLIAALFVAFGWIADRSVRVERHLKEDAQRLNRVLGFMDEVRLNVPHSGQHGSHTMAGGPPPPAPIKSSSAMAQTAAGLNADVLRIEDLALQHDTIGELARGLLNLSSFIDERFRELHALLKLTNEINMGWLLDDVMVRTYYLLQPILPFDRLSVALIDADGRKVRARWARADYPEIWLRPGFSGPMNGSSLEEIISSAEPRIIGDLPAYLERHPQSVSTRLMVSEGIRSSLTCPLISMGKPIGFMFFSSRTAHIYEDVHVDIFKLIAGHMSLVVEKGNMYQQILKEKEKSEHLLLNVMPARIAARLSTGDQFIAEDLPDVGVLFLDIVGFTALADRYPPERVLHMLQNVFVPLDRLCELYGIEKIKTIGDEYMVVSTPTPPADGDHIRNLADFALESLAAVEGMRSPDGQPVSVRIGIHAGPAVAGVIGQTKFAYDVWGDVVNTAHRMESGGIPGRIHATEAVWTRLKDQFVFEERGTIELRGKGSMKAYFLIGKK